MVAIHDTLRSTQSTQSHTRPREWDPWALANREALRRAYPYQPVLCHPQQTNRSLGHRKGPASLPHHLFHRLPQTSFGALPGCDGPGAAAGLFCLVGQGKAIARAAVLCNKGQELPHCCLSGHTVKAMVCQNLGKRPSMCKSASTGCVAK